MGPFYAHVVAVSPQSAAACLASALVSALVTFYSGLFIFIVGQVFAIAGIGLIVVPGTARWAGIGMLAGVTLALVVAVIWISAV